MLIIINWIKSQDFNQSVIEDPVFAETTSTFSIYHHSFSSSTWFYIRTADVKLFGWCYLIYYYSFKNCLIPPFLSTARLPRFSYTLLIYNYCIPYFFCSDFSSDSFIACTSVPQGSHLDPLFFIIYLNHYYLNWILKLRCMHAYFLYSLFKKEKKQSFNWWYTCRKPTLYILQFSRDIKLISYIIKSGLSRRTPQT